jgi:phosphopantothenoylcysteine decarboxylase/phosphopantothenate--cysteine ligase
VSKLKKDGAAPQALALAENPDILATLAQSAARPRLVVGFAAETENLLAHAAAKRVRKGCDWIVANDVSPATGTFGGDANTVHVVDAAGAESWAPMSKKDVAARLAARIARALA